MVAGETMRPLAPLLLLVALTFPLDAASIQLVEVPVPNAVFLDEQGVHPASFRYSGPCNGFGSVTLAIQRGGAVDTRVVAVQSTMAPDLCLIDCFDCPVPFSWVLEGRGAAPLALAGGGMAGLAPVWSMQGPFHEGFLEANRHPFLFPA